MTQQQTSEIADFDAFFAERKASAGPGAQFLLKGRVYELPTQAPLAYVLLTEAMHDRSDVGALREVLTPLFGPDALEEWAAAGMGDEDFEIVLHWAAENMRAPGSVSMEDAAQQVAERDTGKAQPPANRAKRRATAKAGPKKRTTSGARS
ncbi:hypothetical protein [Kitasatospora sp. NPDC056181]|uniref:hypothetical protein n=1 Tax=Kitasatospora sp. NPDC056181 TaxID=3345737 RepID=UPI0035DB188C